MKSLAIAATGMNAQQTNIEVIANNIANINSTSYKRARAEFTDLFYQMDRMQGVANVNGSSPIPEGSNLGLGVKSTAIRKLHIQGALTQTGNPYDLAINGRGWFQVLGPNNEVQYTRAGSFSPNANGQLVTTDGYLLDPAITIPQGTVQVVVNQTGQVFAKLDTEVNPRQIGQLNLANFANEAGLEPLGSNLYRETTASGTPVVGLPGDSGYGKINQQYLEASNVDPVKEITELISAQRAYEMNAKVIQASDEMAQTVSKGMRLVPVFSMSNRVGLMVRGLAAVLLVLVSARLAAAEEKRLPVPAVSIRAGELIRDDMITERAFAPNVLGVAMFIEGRQILVGRMARRALLPGQPIPTNSVEDPWTIARGAMVKVVVEDSGLSIVTYGAAMQSGATGALIPVRNTDTGVIIRGVVQPDGTVKVVDGS
ncbi:flagellar basal-body rod protein FlgG [Bradyrhizobium sp. i1.7.7]